jgi:FAD/FMN-containing dehydrogenase
MLKLSRISHLHANTDKRTATIGAGLTVRKANKKLYELGLSFPAIGSIDEISVGALFTTADHGSSIYTASTSDRAYACTLVTADGRIRQVHKDSRDEEERELFRATGAGCGATGVVVDISFQLDEPFGLAPIYEQICMRDVLARGSGEGGLIDIAKKNEFVKVSTDGVIATDFVELG